MLAASGDELVDEGLAVGAFHMRVLFGVHQDHAVLVEQAAVAFDHNSEIAFVAEGDPGGAVGQRVGAEAAKVDAFRSKMTQAEGWTETHMFFGGVHVAMTDAAHTAFAGAGDSRRGGVSRAV